MTMSLETSLAELKASMNSGNMSQQVATEALLQNCLNYLQIQRASVWLSTDDDLLCCRMLLDKTEGVTQEPLMIDRWSFPGYFQALDTKGIICAPDAHNDPATQELFQSFLLPLQIRSLLDVPLLQDDQLIGIICCEQTKVIKHWSADDIRYVTSLSKIYQPVYAMPTV